MKIGKIFGLLALTSLVAGNYTNNVMRYSGTIVKHSSHCLKNIFEITENLGYCIEKTGDYLLDKTQRAERYYRNLLRSDEYLELTGNECSFIEKKQ